MRGSGGIDLVEEENRSLVRMWGDVDAGLRREASAVMVRLLSRRLPVVVDASDVRFVDSSGIAFILQVHRVSQDDGTGMVLRDASEQVLDMLGIIGMLGEMTLERTVTGDRGPELPRPGGPVAGWPTPAPTDARVPGPSVPEGRGHVPGPSVPEDGDGLALAPAGG